MNGNHFIVLSFFLSAFIISCQKIAPNDTQRSSDGKTYSNILLKDTHEATESVICKVGTKIVLVSCDLGTPREKVNCEKSNSACRTQIASMDEKRFYESFETLDTGKYPKTKASLKDIEGSLANPDCPNVDELSRWKRNLEVILSIQSQIEATETSGPVFQGKETFTLISNIFKNDLVKKKDDDRFKFYVCELPCEYTYTRLEYDPRPSVVLDGLRIKGTVYGHSPEKSLTDASARENAISVCQSYKEGKPSGPMICEIWKR